MASSLQCRVDVEVQYTKRIDFQHLSSSVPDKEFLMANFENSNAPIVYCFYIKSMVISSKLASRSYRVLQLLSLLFREMNIDRTYNS